MTREPKRKISVTLDADLVAAVEADAGENLSARVNAALRADLEDRNRQRALSGLLDRLAAERGPLDTAEDEAEIARFMRLLGGVSDESSQLRAG
jgi:Arc/MetJ-type ribon-helix-helix transcriptional regulator